MNSPARHVQLLIALFSVMGAIDGLTARGAVQSPFALAYACAIAFILYGWCKTHASSRGIEPPFGAAVLAAFLPPIGIPLYFFRAFPVRRAVVSVVKAIAVAISLLFLYALVFWVTSALQA